MKKLYLILFLVLIGTHAALAQCSGGTSAGAITPTAVFQTVNMNTGTYRTFNAVAGNSYIFSFCQGGGTAGFDSQLTLLNSTGVTALAYSDDVCGVASELNWTCTTGGTYRILLNDYFCLGSGTVATLAYRSFVPGPGATCGNPHIIPSLPFTANGLTTCGAGNDYTSADACNSFYMDGDDYVFRYVATGAQTIRITLSGTLSFTGVFVVQGCPNTGGTCIAASAGTGCSFGFGNPNESSSGNPVADFALPGAGTYFFIVDTWPSPACTGFNINVQTVAGGGGGPGCGTYAITTPAYAPDAFNSGTAVVFPDDEFSPIIPLPFTFCFMGTNYNSLVISSNAYVSFNTACATQTSGWDTDILPSPANVNSPEARNSIMFPWCDVDPSVTGTIRYNTYGTAPNRRFVVAFRNVAMFDLPCNSLLYTGQVVLRETSHVIDIYIQNLPNCPSWNGGEAVLGLFDATGTVAVPVPGYNNTVYTLSNFARRFTPTCPTCTVILPVAYEQLSGVHQKDSNVITWSTNHEVNAASFTLEHSRDGQTFEQIGGSVGAGNQPTGNSYTMDDNQPYSQATFYRVVHRDVNGTETISEVIMVGSETMTLAISNVVPKENELLVDLQSENFEPGVRIEMVDVMGKTIIGQSITVESGSTKHSFDISHLTPGIYFLKVTGKQGSESVRKFIRN